MIAPCLVSHIPSQLHKGQGYSDRSERRSLPVSLCAPKQSLQCFDPNVSAAVPKLGKRRGGKRDFGEWRRSLGDESLEPTQRRSLVASRIGFRQ
jgi:hypothetical protein